MVENKQNGHAKAEVVDMLLKPATPRQLGEEGLLVFWRDGIEPATQVGGRFMSKRSFTKRGVVR